MNEKIYDAYNQEIELTKEQQACLKYVGDKTLMVKGYAGSGKSLVLMELARRMIGKYGKNTKNKVAIFTYQNTLVSTTKEYLEINGSSEDGVVVSTINSYVKSVYDKLVALGKAPKRKYPYSGKVGDEARLNNVKKALHEHQAKYGKHRFHDIDASFWLEEFDWMKQLDVWDDDMINYLALPRKGRGGKVKMSSADRVVAYNLYRTYCDILARSGQGDWADQTMYIIRHRDDIPDNMRFENILIDEAQDLTTAQMKAVMVLYKTNMVVAMDANQKIHNRYWTPRSLGFETRTQKLTKSMRTTKQIDALAESVRRKNDEFLPEDDRSLRAIPEREGELPKIVHLDDAASEQKYVVQLVKNYIESNPNITVGIIASKNKQISMYSEWLASASIPHELVKKDSTFSMKKPGVKVVSAYGAKGLEFNCVIIPMFAEGYFPFKFSSDDEEEMQQFITKMRNLVYVSMTRAKQLLTITFWGNNGSRFLADMDASLYELAGNPFKVNVPIQKVAIRKKSAQEPVTVVTSSARTNRPSVLMSSQSIVSTDNDLYDYLKSKGLEVIDKRSKGGAIWVVGGKEIDPVLKETKKIFGALWTFCEKGGTATKHKPGWFSKCSK